MSDEKLDRRVQRTRQALKSAFMELMRENGYDAVTIQDITEKANFGRTTFYLHYESKEALLLDHHAEVLDSLELGRWSREELLSQTEAQGLIEFMDLIANNRGFYMGILQAKAVESIMQGMQAQMADNLSQSLQAAFPEQSPFMPLSVVCHYVAGAQLGLIKWWMTHRNDYSSKQVAHMIQRLQYAAIKDVYRLG